MRARSPLRRVLIAGSLLLASACGASIAPVSTTCTYGGKQYAPGDSFPSSDGCNTCSCGEDGTVACTAMACLKCSYGGKRYAPGETFPDLDGCNTCTCLQDGSVACTDKACPPTCTYAGKTYHPGDSFPALDGCNTCSCGSDGNVGCTKMNCACDPAKEWYRKYVGASPQ